MTTTIIPPAFLFRFSAPVPRVPGLPRKSAPWLRLPDECRLPAPSSLNGERVFGELRAGWNNDGLAIGLRVEGKSFPPFCDTENAAGSDGLRLWFDMRDTKALHHGTRFCQHFCLLPSGGGASGSEPAAIPLPVPRAREDAKLPDPDDILLWSKVEKAGYELEAWFPANTLNGFDPSSQPRMGFHYHLRDSELGDQFFASGAPFPVASDPSLWGTLVFERGAKAVEAKAES
jgi:hypothetical protein